MPMVTYARASDGSAVRMARNVKGTGVATPGTTGICLTGTQAKDATIAADLAAHKVAWARFDALWSSIEQTQGSYNWTDVDAAVDNLRNHGVEPLPILQTIPGWLNGNPAAYYSSGEYVATAVQVGTMTQQKVDAFRAFCSAAATHFKGRVKAWEIWNECNLDQFWAPTPSVADYCQFLQAAYGAIKAVDPTMTVVSAGLGGAGNSPDISTETWWPAFWQQGANAWCDAAGIHHYDPTPGNEWNTERAAYWMAQAGVSKPIWLTETGRATDNTGTIANTSTEAVQADIVSQGYDAHQAASPKGGNVFWYAYADLDRATVANDTEANYGTIRRLDGSEKPAGARVTAIGTAHPGTTAPAVVRVTSTART